MSTVKLSKSIIKRKIITCILTISLVLGSFSFAFASPATADNMADALGSGWTYTNSLGAPYGDDMTTSWYYIFGRNSLSYLRDLRYQLTGNDYDTHTGTSLYTYINNIYSTLTNTGTGSILYGINQTNTKLSDIYDSIGVGGSGNNVLSKLSALINAVGDISIPDLTSYVSNIDTGVTTINTDGVKLTGNALNRLNQIAGYTSWISTIRDTVARIESIDTTISAISSDMYSQLSSFNYDFNDITWTDNGTYKGILSTLDGSYISTSGNLREGYIVFNGINTNGLFRVTAGVSLNNLLAPVDLEVGYIYNGSFIPIEWAVITMNTTTTTSDFLVIAGEKYRSLTNYDMAIHFKSSGYIRVQPNGNTYCIDIDKQDFYTVQNYVFNRNFIDLLRQAKEMFFDDDTLQAKRNNAGQTSAVLTGFTGSGQASATANDYGTLSAGVSDVKGGMTTNVSANNAFGIFNNSNGYSFWSVETLQELNSSGTNSRNLSKSNDNDGYVYYNDRLEYLLNAMIGGEKK